jgi:hypothetical protein
VPTGRPYRLSDLQGKVPALGDQVHRSLSSLSHSSEYDSLADDLHAAFLVAESLAPPRSVTGCSDHPRGPVDPVAPDGWSRCLQCNSYRRRGEPFARPTLSTMSAGGYSVPSPPYTYAKLVDAMRLINDLTYELNLRSENCEFEAVADALHAAFVVARELARPRNFDRCLQHPGAPLDVDVPDGPQCMFCRVQQARRLAQDAPVMLPPVRRGERRNGFRRYPRPAFERGPEKWR